MLDRIKVNRELKNLWDKVSVKGEGECWNWLGWKDRYGYGRVSYKGRREQLITRVAWELINGPIPEGLCVCHKCDNPSCLNLSHLFIATHAENIRDMKNKKRGRGKVMYGLDNPKTKLSKEQVREIRRRRAAGEKGVDLAKEFDVTDTAICSIYKGRNHKRS
jgi:hypothetical protein